MNSPTPSSRSCPPQLLAERLRRAALAAVPERSWDAALSQLAVGYRRALHERRAGGASRGIAQCPVRLRTG
jgi:hypothetical protein